MRCDDYAVILGAFANVTVPQHFFSITRFNGGMKVHHSPKKSSAPRDAVAPNIAKDAILLFQQNWILLACCQHSLIALQIVLDRAFR